MREDFLHFLWRYQRFAWEGLATTTGEPVAVLHPGETNSHGGPDFLNARIRIDDTLWAGHVEIHVRSSEWKRHGHDADPAYDNVILHVVLEEDHPLFRQNGERIPCLELKRRIPRGMQAAYFRLLQQKSWIPCQAQWKEAGELTKQVWVERMSVERLEAQTQRLQGILQHYQQDWEQAFYCALARNLGHPANADPFEELARRTPLHLLQRKRGNPLQVEALLFGQAGMLEEDFDEDYPRQLQQEYRFLQQQYDLTSMKKQVWKFLRMRPANFPTVRIAQLARLILQSNHLFDKAMSATTVEEWEAMFELKVSQYWRTHYRFGQPSPPQSKSLGRTAVHTLLINTVAPFLFLFGAMHQSQRYLDRALYLLHELPAEDNCITRNWEALGMKPEDAAQSQGLLHLKNRYCDPFRCLECAIGHEILKNAGKEIGETDPRQAEMHTMS